MKAYARGEVKNKKFKPIQTLDTHSKGVFSRFLQVFPGDITDKEEKLIKIITLSHDFGKLNPNFQEYLKNEEVSSTESSAHAHQGALLAALLTEEIDLFSERDIFIAYTTVRFHHQSLPDLSDIQDEFETGDIADKASREYDKLTEAFSSKYTAEYVQSELDSLISSSLEELVDSNSFEFLFNIRWDRSAVNLTDLYMYYSCLCLSDKTDSAGIPTENITNTSPPDSKKFNEYISQFSNPNTPLDIERTNAQKEIIENTEDFINSNKKIARINLPTGFGKTIAGFQSALKLIDSDKEFNKIIYALPFTSIIDQVSQNIEEDYFEYDKNSSKYTVHHHLSETKSELESTIHGNLTYQKKEMYAKSWASSIVLTTFVQLFESIIGPENMQSTKLPNLQNSIIILDEPQSIPLKWWVPISKVLEELVNKYNCKIISLTATQPRFFEEYSSIESVSLVNDVSQKYNYLKQNPRIRYKLDSTVLNYIKSPNNYKKSYEEAATEIVNKIDRSDTTNILSITNTIESTKMLYTKTVNKLKNTSVNTVDLNKLYYRDPEYFKTDSTKDFDKDTLYYGILTTRKQPKERKFILKKLKELLEEDYKIVLFSTQLIEAGVDVSFEQLYRDYAPLPNIVQAAGRCNRENKGDISTVKVWVLDKLSENGNIPSKQVYGRKIQLTNTVLNSKKSTYSEYKMNLEKIKEFYQNIRDTESLDQSIWSNFTQKNCSELQKESLIEQNCETIDIVIPLSKSEKNIVNEYQNPDLQNIENANKYFAKMNKKIKQLTVSVPVWDLDTIPTVLIPIENGLYKLENNSIKQKYVEEPILNLNTTVEDQFW